MATSIVSRVISFPQSVPVPARKNAGIPSTFRDALKQGWLVVRDQSKQSGQQKRREGVLTMQNPGRAELLEVEYIGTSAGYRFSVPKLVTTN